ncbi:MAG TPA: TauD/TfdA family dioxygenase [Rubrivivax sp.]|nr:TauD/TfdA family dioxygenase [Rubrivivax sp.]
MPIDAPAGAAAPLSPFDLADGAAYRRWRDWKLAQRPQQVGELIVDVADPCALSAAERGALLRAIGRGGVALYRSAAGGGERHLPRQLGAQLGIQRLDANWLADDDGISPIAVSGRSDAREGRGGFIPYTDRPIRWHTDGYYHPRERTIRALVLHCVRPARQGGENALLDPELAYVALRDAQPEHIRALMQPDAMTIPAREDESGVARAAQAGPVFSVDAGGRLQLRYTARTRSIVWKDDAPTRAAAAAIEALLAGSPWVQRVRLEAGMGLVGHNVLHDRSGFVDDPAAPRLLYRARFIDRIATPLDDAWR